MQTETLYEIHANGSCLGIGNLDEIVSLANDGIIPPREELTLVRVGDFDIA